MKVMFIKPALEIDAVWDLERTAPYLGMWYLASHLKEKGHEVRYLDEVVRYNGRKRKRLYDTTRDRCGLIVEPNTTSFGEFQRKKMSDFNSMSPHDFVQQYSAFNDCFWQETNVQRVIARIGVPEDITLFSIGEFEPDIIGIPLIASANYLPATSLAKSIKRYFPDVKLIFGGQHVSAMPTEFLRANPYVDHVVTGDAISVIDDIVEGNVTHKIVHGGFQTMDKFPLLDLSLLEENGYSKEQTHSYPTFGRKAIDYMFSKGCFRSCDFCVAGSQKGNQVTAVDYSKAREQLRLFRDAGIEELILQDDAFLWDSNHVKDHLPKVLDIMKDYGFYWQDNGGVDFESVDTFVSDYIRWYNIRGKGKCTFLYVPFNPRQWNKSQCTSKTMLSRYHKNLENLKRLRDNGVYIFSSVILGTPEQTPEIFEEELATGKELIEKGYIDSALCLSATMLPGTKWYKTNGRNIIHKQDYPGYSLFTTHHRTAHFGPQAIEELFVRWMKELNSMQKTYLWQTAFANSVDW